jgi:DNA repair protein RecO (recombination protein O)
VRQLVTTAIILSRTDYGEADRILSLLTPEFGKLSLLAKGVRRVKSKLAGGIELFSVSEITFIKGRGEVGTLVSTRLVKHYEQIVKDLNRTMLGYDLIKRLNKVTEDETESEYFDLLKDTFEALNDKAISLDIVRFWFGAQLLRMSGHSPNLQTDEQGSKLEADQHYLFNFDNMGFVASPDHGQFGAGDIKFLRLAFAGNSIHVLSHVQGCGQLAEKAAPLVNTMITTYLRV